jgi:hypothetical protein
LDVMPELFQLIFDRMAEMTCPNSSSRNRNRTRIASGMVK